MKALLAFALSLGPAYAYSVLTHEAVVDSLWPETMVPLIQKRFAGVTEAQLKEAHANAYGGAIIQDLGYYPFGSKQFSDMVHYVRSGDFVESLLRNAQTPEEYGFALGAMAHFFSDRNGHPIGVNPSVALLFPKLRKKFGGEITYAEDPSSHLKTEFGFDVLQVAKGRYAPEAYHDFIGFALSKRLLEQAFLQTYGLELDDIIASENLAFGTFRFAVGGLIPEMTKVAWEQKHDEIERTALGATRQKFLYNLSRASYQKEWGSEYKRPGFFARLLAWIFRIIPKIGPFRALSYRMPTPEAEKLFMESFNAAVSAYRQAAAAITPNLPNPNLDTGEPVKAGEYSIADRAYAKYLEKLAEEHKTCSKAARLDIVRFYGPTAAPESAKAAALLAEFRAPAQAKDPDRERRNQQR